MFATFPMLSRDFTYTYEGQTLTYYVLDESAKTCRTKASDKSISGSLIIPSVAKDGETEYTVTSIDFCGFMNCSGLTSVSIPSSVTSIGQFAFKNCSGLTTVTIPVSIDYISQSAFENCIGLTSIMIPNSVTAIGQVAFRGCTGLTSLEIPNSVTSIGNLAFAKCSGLTSVEISNSVTSIGDFAFAYCTALTDIYYKTTDPVEANKNIFDDNIYTTATLYVAQGSLDKARSTNPWASFTNIRETGTSAVENIDTDSIGIDFTAPVEVYNLQGIHVSDALDSLPRGIYIVRQANTIKKIAI